MSGVTLTWTGGDAVDAALLQPALARQPLDAIRQAVGRHFEVSGESGDRLTLRNLPRVDRLGENMNEGELVIEGDAGDHVGYRMRRGLIVVKGKAGRCPGYRMRAGTLVVAQGPYDHPGLEMRRGTIVLADPHHAIDADAAFQVDGRFDGAAMRLVVRHLSGLGVRFAEPVRFEQLSGDRLQLGRGEIWQIKG